VKDPDEKEIPMKDRQNRLKRSLDRRSFMKNGLTAGVATMGTGLLVHDSSVFADQDDQDAQGHRRRLDKGDASILRFLAAAEFIESDLWQQYNELGGIQDSEVPGGSGSPLYIQPPFRCWIKTWTSTSTTTLTMNSRTKSSSMPIWHLSLSDVA
jgi:hypothetical protein